MRIIKEIPELLQAGVISEGTAIKIEEYYRSKKTPVSNNFFLVSGILGAILVGLGVILILAHNWDTLSRELKLFFAFLPLVSAQALCGYALLKKRDSDAWREVAATLLFFGVAASIALVSQIYNIPGDLNDFVLSWMLLCIPIIYVMRSSVVSLFCIIGITYYGYMEGYWHYPRQESYLYWGLMALVLPYYYLLYKRKSKSNFMTFHNWLVPLSFVLVLGTLSYKHEEFMNIAYMSLFGIFYLIGDSNFFSVQKLRNNGYRVIGALGTIITLLIYSFDWFWLDLNKADLANFISAPEFLSALVLTIAAVVLFVKQMNLKAESLKPVSLVFFLFIVIFIIGIGAPLLATVLVNILVFAIGLFTMRLGTRQDHLVILNYGLLVIAALIACRFFDTELSFVFRGLMFIAIGIGFFVANYFRIQKRRENELE